MTRAPRRRAIRPSRRLATIALLCVGLAVAIALRVDDMHLKRGIPDDEGLTYAVAAGHQDEYYRAKDGGLAGKWVAASEWKDMLQPDGFWGFGDVRVGLTEHSIHPPLYFWLFHVWVWLLGVKLWTGPLLNLLFSLCTAFAIFALARRLMQHTVYAAFAAAIWACSYPVVVISRTARHYELFALLTVLFVLASLRFLTDRKAAGRGDWIALALVTAACLLTHYEFFAFAAGSVLLFVVMLWRDRRRLLIALGALLAGAVLATALNPYFYESFVKQREHTLVVQSGKAQLARRVDVTRFALQSFFRYAVPSPEPVPVPLKPTPTVRHGLLAGAVVVAAAAAFGLALLIPRTRRLLRRAAARVSRDSWAFLAFLVLAAATTILPYLTFQVPDYAMGKRYQAMFWPLLAVAVTMAVKALGKPGVVVAAALGVWMLVPAVYLMAFPVQRAPVVPFPSDARRLIVNSTIEGKLLPALWPVPGDVEVFAKSSTLLAARADQWLTDLPRGTYFANIYSRRDPASGMPLKLLQEHYGLREVTHMWWSGGTLYEVLDPLPGTDTQDPLQ